MSASPIPVILDTDIGSDIDDTWALAMLLKSPELDVKLVVSDTGDTDYRARILAKFLEVSGRTDIPVGVGVLTTMQPHRIRQAKWVDSYALDSYPGVVHQDGVQAIIDTAMASPEPVTLICIGPVPNIAAALEREPAIAAKANFVGMHGSFHVHHKTNHHLAMAEGQIAEFNVVGDIPAIQTVFRAPWNRAAITPLDSCAMIVLDGDRYQRVRRSTDPMIQAVMENYDIWSPWNDTNDPKTHSSVLFDTVAVYLAFTTKGLRMETHPITVDDQGYMHIDPAARPIEIGMGWEDLDGFLDFLTDRLLS
jgi:inosine-uridine nucleoside N-ribohydrolase